MKPCRLNHLRCDLERAQYTEAVHCHCIGLFPFQQAGNGIIAPGPVDHVFFADIMYMTGMAHAVPGKLPGLITVPEAMILIDKMICRDKPEFGPEVVQGDFGYLINPFNDDKVPGFTDLCARFQHLHP